MTHQDNVASESAAPECMEALVGVVSPFPEPALVRVVAALDPAGWPLLDEDWMDPATPLVPVPVYPPLAEGIDVRGAVVGVDVVLPLPLDTLPTNHDGVQPRSPDPSLMT